MIARERTVLVLAAFVAVAMLPANAAANMGDPSRPGDVLGEPAGALSELHVEHESLLIDLRPLEQGAPAMVEATYRIRNDGAPRTVDLLFVAAAREGGASVSVDGQPVEVGTGDGGIRASWSPPQTTPALDTSEPLRYVADEPGNLRFALPLSPGQHDVIVRYGARAGSYSGSSSPARYWQLGYVLAPARDWPTFGTLDVVVQLPAGWLAASEPALERSGDELRGSFVGVPADTLAITTRAHVLEAMAWVPFVAAIAVVLIVGWLLAWPVGRWLEARKRSAGWMLPISIIYAVVGALTIVAGGLMGFNAQFVPLEQRSTAYGYGVGWLLILGFPLIFIALLIGIQMMAWLAWKRRARAERPVG
jgi:hypothetical protein